MFVVAAILLAIFVLPFPWGWVAIGVGILVEAVETVVWMRLLGRHRTTVGAEALIGAVGRTTSTCRPFCEINVRGEAWRARCDTGADADAPVRVLARDGITLVVEPIPEPHASGESSPRATAGAPLPTPARKGSDA